MHPPLPDKIELVPENGNDGRPTQWKRGVKSLSLSAPILDFCLDKFLDDQFVLLAKSVISAWALWDNENIHLRNSGILNAAMPTRYKTNEPLDATGSMRMGLIGAGDNLKAAVDNLSRNLLWTAGCMSHGGRQGVAVRMALLLRRLHVDSTMELWSLLRELCLHLGLPEPKHVDSYTAGLDAIDAAIEAMLPDAWKGEQLTPISKLASRTWKPRKC